MIQNVSLKYKILQYPVKVFMIFIHGNYIFLIFFF